MRACRQAGAPGAGQRPGLAGEARRGAERLGDLPQASYVSVGS